MALKNMAQSVQNLTREVQTLRAQLLESTSQLQHIHSMASTNTELARVLLGDGGQEAPGPPLQANAAGEPSNGSGGSDQDAQHAAVLSSAPPSVGTSLLRNPLPAERRVSLMPYREVPSADAFQSVRKGGLYMDAANFYRVIMAKGGLVPERFDQDGRGDKKACANQIFRAFDAMVKPDEKIVLMPPRAAARVPGDRHAITRPDEGERTNIENRLKHLVIAGLVHLYIESGKDVPWGLAQSTGNLPLSGPNEHFYNIPTEDAGKTLFKTQLLQNPGDVKACFQALRALIETKDLGRDLDNPAFKMDRLLQHIPDYTSPVRKKRKKDDKSGEGAASSGKGDQERSSGGSQLPMFGITQCFTKK